MNVCPLEILPLTDLETLANAGAPKGQRRGGGVGVELEVVPGLVSSHERTSIGKMSRETAPFFSRSRNETDRENKKKTSGRRVALYSTRV